jgi:hypothetical protein
MIGWMIAVDGSAVNLARVERVTAGLSAMKEREGTGRWYVAAEFDERRVAVMASKMDTREDAVAWIERHFRSFDQHANQAIQVGSGWIGPSL